MVSIIRFISNAGMVNGDWRASRIWAINRSSMEIKKDYNDYTAIGTFTTKNKNIEKYYFKAKVKAKKFKSLQQKFSSTRPFSLVSFVSEAYLGSVVKR